MSGNHNNNNNYPQSDDDDDDDYDDDDGNYQTSDDEGDGSFFDEVIEGQEDDDEVGYNASDDGGDEYDDGSDIEEEASYIDEDIDDDGGDAGSFYDEQEEDADDGSYIEEEVFEDDDFVATDEGMDDDNSYIEQDDMENQYNATVPVTRVSNDISPHRSPSTRSRRPSLPSPHKTPSTATHRTSVSSSSKNFHSSQQQQPFIEEKQQHPIYASPKFHANADTDDENGEYYTSEDDDNNYVTNDEDEQSYADDEEGDYDDDASQYEQQQSVDDNQSYDNDEERDSGSVNDEYESIGLIEGISDMLDDDDNSGNPDERASDEDYDDDESFRNEQRSVSEDDNMHKNNRRNNASHDNVNKFDTDDPDDGQHSYESNVSKQYREDSDDSGRQHDDRSYDDEHEYDHDKEDNLRQSNDEERPIKDYYNDDYGEQMLYDNESGTCSQPYIEDEDEVGSFEEDDKTLDDQENRDDDRQSNIDEDQQSNADEDQQSCDEEDQESYIEDDQQSYIEDEHQLYDENDEQSYEEDDQQSYGEDDHQSYESEHSQQKEYVRNENDTYESEEYDQHQNHDNHHNDEEQTFESASSSQKDYDDEQTYESESKSKDTQIPYAKVDNYGDNDPVDDNQNDDSIVGNRTRNGKTNIVLDEFDAQQLEHVQQYEGNDTNDAGNLFSNRQQFNDEFYETNLSQDYYVNGEDNNMEYEGDDDDNATFISEVIGPPPFVDDEETEAQHEDETDKKFEGSNPTYLVSENHDLDDSIDSDSDWQRNSLVHNSGFGQSRHSDQLRPSSHMDRSSVRSTTSNEVSLYDDEDDNNDEDDEDAPLEYSELGPPSYHTLKSEAANKNSTSSHNSIPRGSLTSQTGKLMNLGVNANFLAYSDKRNSLQGDRSVAPSVSSNTSKKSNSESQKSIAADQKIEESKREDEVFIVNTSNRGAQSNMYFSETRQLSNDFSVDMQILDTDFDGNNNAKDPATSSDKSVTKSTSSSSPRRGTRRNDSTDSERFFRVANKYISNDKKEATSLAGENHEAIRDESIRSDRSSYASGSNHAAAKYEDSGNKRFSFVGSDDGSENSNTNSFEEGDSYDDNNIKLTHSVTSDDRSHSESNIKQQYNVLRDVARQITTVDDLRNEISETSLTKPSIDIGGNGYTVTPNENIALHSNTSYQVYSVSVERSPPQVERVKPIHFDRKDSVDSYPTKIYADSLGYKPLATETSRETKIGDIVLEEEHGTSSDASDSSTSTSPEEIANQYWKEQIDAAVSPRRHASSYEVERAHVHAQQSMAVISVGGNTPKISHPWIPTDDKKKPATPLLKQKSSTSDDLDIGDMESGVFDPTENYAENNNEQNEQSTSRKRHKKTPRWLYGTIGIVFLFVFMLMVVLLRKNKNTSMPNEIPPITAPIAPAPSPQASISPTPPGIPSVTLGPQPASNLIPFVLRSTLTGSSDGVSGFGSSVALYDFTLVVGEPEITTVRSYLTSSDGSVGEERSLSADASNQFGKVIDLMNRTLAIGAPSGLKDGEAASIDEVYVYNNDPATQSWIQVGAVLRSNNEGEEFGSAVATSIEYRVVVGAPMSSGSSDRRSLGRVYTYKYQESSQSWMSSELFPLVGTEAGDMFGTSVAISRDGTRFLAGAPGTNSSGYVRIYYWIDTRWQLLSVIRGNSDSEACGSSVSILSEFGDYIAIGCPGFNNDAGRVAVYQQQQSSGRYVQLGSDIVGDVGDQIGYFGGLTGDVSIVGPVVVIATMSGYVRRYDYNVNANSWDRFYTDVTYSDVDRAVVAFTCGDSTDTLVVGQSGSSNQVLIYNAESMASLPELSTTVPTTAPQQQSLTTNEPTTSPIFVATPIAIPVATSAPTTIPVKTSTPTTLPVATPVFTTTFAPIPGLNSYPTVPPVSTPATTPQSRAPVSVPVNSNELWAVAGGPFLMQQQSDVTPVVALSKARMVMGSSLTGTVLSYFHQTVTILSIWATDPYQELIGFNEYGTSLDMSTTANGDNEESSLLVVGAPGGAAGGTVYAYRIDTNTGDWVLYGSTILSTSPNERFGSTVAISSPSSSSSSSTTPRIAIGAPMNNNDNTTIVSRGRVTICEYDTSMNDWTIIETIYGSTNNELFGSAIDISSSGNFLIVGGPGYSNQIGLATIYQYSTLNWFVATTIVGDSGSGESAEGEQFGSSVRMVSSDGFIVAVGAPYYGGSNKNGRVVVYERNALTGKYTMIGEPIIGEPNEQIGLPNSIAGTANSSKTIIQVTVKTATGLVKLYMYNKSMATPTWTYKTIVDQSSLSTGIFSIATTSDVSSIVVATNDGIATIYNAP